MAFFDNIGRTLSEKGQIAVKKTKDFAEVTKINSLISDEERSINNNYVQIGKLYVSKHSDDCEEEFRGFLMYVGTIEADETTTDVSELILSEYKNHICAHADIPALAEQAINDVCTPGNPREVTKQDILDLYHKIL